jgi:hypothetical protein
VKNNNNTAISLFLFLVIETSMSVFCMGRLHMPRLVVPVDYERA